MSLRIASARTVAGNGRSAGIPSTPAGRGRLIPSGEHKPGRSDRAGRHQNMAGPGVGHQMAGAVRASSSNCTAGPTHREETDDDEDRSRSCRSLSGRTCNAR